MTLMRANYEIDVRHVLASIHAPTLILHRVGDAFDPGRCRTLPGGAHPGSEVRGNSRN